MEHAITYRQVLTGHNQSACSWTTSIKILFRDSRYAGKKIHFLNRLQASELGVKPCRIFSPSWGTSKHLSNSYRVKTIAMSLTLECRTEPGLIDKLAKKVSNHIRREQTRIWHKFWKLKASRGKGVKFSILRQNDQWSLSKGWQQSVLFQRQFLWFNVFNNMSCRIFTHLSFPLSFLDGAIWRVFRG